MSRLIRLLSAGLCAVGVAGASAASTAGAAPAGFALAVAFDSSLTATAWLHTTATTYPPTGQVVRYNAGTVSRTDSTVTAPPPELTAIPGVVPGDLRVGVFPAYNTLQNFAMYTVTPARLGTADVLAPGTARFTFGADFKLDRGTTVGVGVGDDGNNLVQRGLYGGDQFKLQVDVRPGLLADASDDVEVLSCSVRESGVTTATAKVTVRDGQWFRARCEREVVGGLDVLILSVTNLSTGAVYPEVATVGSVAAARLDFPDANLTTGRIPMSIGGKVSASGVPMPSSTDQFNGRIDNVYYRVG